MRMAIEYWKLNSNNILINCCSFPPGRKMNIKMTASSVAEVGLLLIS